MNQQPMRPKAEWAIDSKATRARGIIVLVKSNELVTKISTTSWILLILVSLVVMASLLEGYLERKMSFTFCF